MPDCMRSELGAVTREIDGRLGTCKSIWFESGCAMRKVCVGEESESQVVPVRLKPHAHCARPRRLTVSRVLASILLVQIKNCSFSTVGSADSEVKT